MFEKIKQNDKFLKITLLVIGIVAVGLLISTTVKLFRVSKQVEVNKEVIKEQAKPCSTEDVRFPERSPGC